jgi:hypothetical protein
VTEIAIPSDRNIKPKEAKKKLKCENLSTEIQRTWNMKCFVIPVSTGATGIVSKGLKSKYLETIPGKNLIASVQKEQLCIIRKVLGSEI